MAESLEFTQPVLRDIHHLFVKHFIQALREMNADIKHIMLGDEEEIAKGLFKADRLLDPRQPGSRGGKWFRDVHGHVRYGQRPTPRFNTAMSDEEGANLENNLQVIMSAGSMLSILNFIANDGEQHLTSQDASTLMALGATARTNGESLKDAYAQFMAESVVAEYDTDTGDIIPGTDLPPTPEDIEAHWNRLAEGWDLLTKKEGFSEAVQGSLQKIQDDDERVQEGLDRNAAISGALATDVLKDKPPVVSLKLVASMLLHGWGEVGTSLPEKAGRRKLDDSELGRFIVPERGIFEAVLHLDTLTSSQIATLVLAAKQHLPTMEERLSAVSGDAKMAFKFQWFGNHYDVTDNFFSAYEEEQGRILTLAEKTKYQETFNHVAQTLVQTLHYINRGNDGGSITKLFDKTVKPEDLLKNPDYVTAMASRQTAFQALRADALKAQDNTQWALSDRIKATLFPHQARYLNWSHTVKKGINAGGTGVGKTLMAVALTDKLMEEGKEPRGIITTTPTAMAQWVGEIEKFRPGSKVVSLHEGMSRQDKIDMVNSIEKGHNKPDFVLLSNAIAKQYSEATLNKSRKPAYLRDEEGKLVRDEKGKLVQKPGAKGPVNVDLLLANHDSDDLMGPLSRLKGAMFVDEAHTAVAGTRNVKNNGWAAFRKHMEKREHGFLMTATPMSKDPGELYNMMSLVVPAAVGPDKKKWLSKITVHTVDPQTGKSSVTGYGRFAEMNKDIQPFVYALRKSDPEVAEHVIIPPKDDINMPLAFEDPEHKDMYDRACKEVLKEAKSVLAGGKADKEKYLNIFTKILQQRQVAITPELVDPSYTKRTPKIQACIDIVMKHFQDPTNHGKPVVIFSALPSVFPILARELQKEHIHPSQIRQIHADVDVDERSAIQDATNEGKLAVVLIGVASGGAGLNLQKAADTMIMLDKGPSPTDLAQAIGRLHRTGSNANRVKQFNLMTENSYDQKVLDALGKKLALSDAILYAHRGEDAVQQITVQTLHSLVKDIEMKKITPEDAQALRDEYKALGYGGELPTPERLRKEFKLEEFVEKRERKAYRDMTGHHVDDALNLANYRLSAKLMTTKQHEDAVRRLKHERAAWQANVGKMPDLLTGTQYTPRNIRPIQPEVEYIPAKSTPYEKTSDLQAFYKMVRESKMSTPKDFAEKYLRGQIGEEEWLKETAPGEASTPEKASAFASEVFRQLATTGGIAERTPNPNVDVSVTSPVLVPELEDKVK